MFISFILIQYISHFIWCPSWTFMCIFEFFYRFW